MLTLAKKREKSILSFFKHCSPRPNVILKGFTDATHCILKEPYVFVL